ncbi:hypothetical protein H6F86_20685 [Phormidium sp. FACHB-592]|uniref:Uncharacterized protein n=1 Tax=Stenomitos frigidus AS-A4 TaxID=2933935 RepID=A0ABV0KEL4_9CYAN|nr:hypothetical protein [Phormidium sp. FACHB-592]MBD2076250.1 hypothetical protein [Phormidium sp. FACHB-592]
MPFINSLVIPCPVDLVAAYNNPDEECPLFDTVANALILRVQPGDYKPIRQKQIERRDGFTSATLTASTALLGMEVTITDGREEIRYALEELESIAQSVPGTYQLITILDYCRPERQDRLTGFTTRLGYFEEIEGLAGNVRTGLELTSRREGNGVRFTFFEGQRRR